MKTNIINERDYRNLTDEFTPEEIEWLTRAARRVTQITTLFDMPYLWMLDGTPIIDAPEMETLAELMQRIEGE